MGDGGEVFGRERTERFFERWNLRWLREEKDCHRHLEAFGHVFHLNLGGQRLPCFPGSYLLEVTLRVFERVACPFARSLHDSGGDRQAFFHLGHVIDLRISIIGDTSMRGSGQNSCTVPCTL